MKNSATLLVDATNLYKIVFEGVKSYSLQKQNIHAVWGFLKKLRGALAENINSSDHQVYITKTILFWDGPNSGKLRKEVYPNYKEKRNRYFEGIDPYYQQKEVLIELLSFLGITSYRHNFVETDDCIAEYVRQNQSKENILILSNDHDYFQLISKNVYVYYLNRMKVQGKLYPKNVLINSENFDYYFDYNPKNILLRKIIIGDESDNIVGARGFSEKSIINEVPMFVKREYNREQLLEYAKKQLEKKKKSKRLEILIDFLEDEKKFELCNLLINLKNNTFVAEDCASDIASLKHNTQIDLKTFYQKCKETGIAVQIKTDLDFNGDVKFFCEPFLLTHKK